MERSIKPFLGSSSPKLIDLTGRRFGRWVVAYRAESQPGTAFWCCVCDCGKIRKILNKNLISGRSRSCGCLRREESVERNNQMRNDLTGREFGLLRVYAFAGVTDYMARWWCMCRCGNTVKVTAANLLRGNSKSCGCRRHVFSGGDPVHGEAGKTREYAIWCGLNDRCRNPHHVAWERYGGRGISVCGRWQGPNGYSNFLADMGRCPPNFVIDRTDNNGNYTPKNCRWVSRKISARNTSSNVRITFNGKTKVVSAWEEDLGFPSGYLHRRIRLGWSVERAFTTPVKKHAKHT